MILFQFKLTMHDGPKRGKEMYIKVSLIYLILQ